MATTALIRPNSDPRALTPSAPPQTLAPYKADSNDSGSDEATETKNAPEPKRPVPFILLLLLVSAGVLAFLPILGACSLKIHRILFQVGAAATLPLLVSSILFLCGGRGWLFRRFFEGEYSEGATSRQLPFLWYPEQVQILKYTTGEHAGRKIETYAAWETNAIVEYVENVRGGNRDGGCVERDENVAGLDVGAAVRISGLQKAPELNGLHGSCQQWIADQGRWRIKLENGNVKDVKLENLESESAGNWGFKVTIPASFGTDVKVALDARGKLSGYSMPFNAEFNGSAIIATSGPRAGQAWMKAGYWRMDFVMKMLMAMAVVGLESMFAASVLPPGVVSAGSARLPLKAVYLVDGSGSITPPQWQAAMRANKKFIADFEDVYSSEPGKLNFGFVQFSTQAVVELPITHDLTSVTSMLDNIQQRQGDTFFDKALSLCQQLLDGYTEAGTKTFDVCVLITDGEDRSYLSEYQLKGLVAKDTAVFGIFVGSDQGGGAKLHNIVGCGKAEGKGKQGCDFFASATDFEGLAAKTHEIAEDVARGSDMVLCAERSALIETPVIIGLVVPAVLWYLSFCTVTIAERRINSYNSNKASSDELMRLHDQA